MARPVPVISGVEFVLGALWAGPATVEELRRAYLVALDNGIHVVASWEDIEAVLRGMRSQGLVRMEGGRLVLVRERLHPMARRAAELAARDLAMLG